MADNKRDEQDDVGPKQMELGGTGTASASFKDAFGKDVKASKVQWASSGSVVVQADDKDPTKATVLAVGAGPGSIRAMGDGEDGGHYEASISVMALAKGEIADGKIDLEVRPAPVKAKPAEPKPAEPAHAGVHR